MMRDVVFTSMIFAEMCRTTGLMMTLKKALFKMRTNVDSFSLRVFVKAGREGATRSDSRFLWKISLLRPALPYLVALPFPISS